MNPPDIEQLSPVVSVVLPVYNAKLYVGEAVRSILKQTFRDLELIIIDDGSTDGSLQILKDLETVDARIVLISRDNRGIPKTLNEGIRIARGRWLAIMNADDIALPSRLERQIECIIQSGADACGSWVQFFGTADRRILKHPKSDQAIKAGLMFGSMFAQPTVMMKTASVKKLMYDEDCTVAEDYDLWVRGAQAGWVMTNVQEVLLLYRLHENQISNIESPKMLAISRHIRSRYWRSVLESSGLCGEWIDEVLKLREPFFLKPNMDIVDQIFNSLLQQYQEEARATIFFHMTRLYLRAAGRCPDIVFRWRSLNNLYGTTRGLRIQIQLVLLSLLRAKPDSRLFQHLKQIYFHLR